MNYESKSDVNVSLISLIGLLGVLLLYFTIISSQAWYYRVEKAEINQKVVLQPSSELESYRASEINKLYTYRWIDKEKKVMAIPIDQAMQLVARELNAASPTP